MFDLLLVVISIALGSLLLPFGLLPSILGFRDLANGLDASAGTKRAYALALWGGLLFVWVIGAAMSLVLLRAVFG